MAVNRIRGAFAVPRKGETFELRAGLVSQYAYERKESIQKTIMAMTLGKDVSALFPDVLKNIATGDLDQKKLVYLYLILRRPKSADTSTGNPNNGMHQSGQNGGLYGRAPEEDAAGRIAVRAQDSCHLRRQTLRPQPSDVHRERLSGGPSGVDWRPQPHGRRQLSDRFV
ncbi:hypothetical protein LB505_004679 [Fusarium chuoi]|nr:hypothetical protein LB503_012242 [Fusarium chuoi]KAI1039822.1 hypothetical protein LB505_004679 [Fusarium chuoi]